MGIKARNPRANLVDAHHLHSMAQLHQKKSKMNIEWLNTLYQQNLASILTKKIFF